ncbi:MAG: hypothetical protein IH613_08915 [Desulfuromonadales bacterium]|nr:hypothetical protein [Desulfuromonadales bacterium]
MTRGVRILIGLILLVLLFAGGGLWLAADRLLDGVVRPWLTARAAAELDAEVGLEKLAYADGSLRLTDLTFVRPGELRLEVAAIDVQFSWVGLLQRRINELVIREPQLIWTAAAQEAAAEPATWPQDAPLSIDAWRLENGRVELSWGDRKLLLDQLAAEGGLGRQFPYAMTANVGIAPAVPVSLVGNAVWQDGLALTLDELSWDEKNLLAQPVSVTPGADMALGTKLTLEKLDDAQVGELLVALGEPVPWPADLHWQVTAPALELRLRDGGLEVKLQSGAGSLQTAGQHWPWQSMTLGLQGGPDRLELGGSVSLGGATTMTLNGIWADQKLNGSWSVAAESPAAFLQSIGMAMPTAAPAPSDLKLQGLIEADRNSARISKAGLVSNFGKLGTLAGDVRGEWRDQRLTLTCDRLTLTARDGRTSLAEAALSLAGTPAESDWQGDWSLQVADVTRLALSSGYPLPTGQPGLQELSLQGKLRLQNDRLSLPGVDLSGMLTGAGFSGLLHGRLTLQTAPGMDLAVILEAITLDALEYQAEDGMAGLTGGKLDLRGRLKLDGERVRFDLSGRAGAGEALLDSWYGSLQGLPVNFVVKGNWLGDRQRLELTSADVDLAGLVNGHFSAVYAEGETSLRGQVEVAEMQGDFQQTIQTLAGELLPGIDQASLRGQLMLEGAARQREGSWGLDLNIVPTDVTVAWGQDVRVDGLNGRLPVHLRQGASARDALAEIANLQWTRLQAGLLNSGPGRLQLQAATNRWRLQQPLKLTVAGGELSLTVLQLDLPNLVPQLWASLAVEDVELLQISRSLDWPEMGGRLNARLEEIRIAGAEISTVGDASMHVFGGDFSINNMRVEAPFSRFPTYHADVDFTGIDLYQLTNTFEFGEINGIADGYIHSLRLFDGMPSAFRAKFETRSEGTRNISVKAIRNLNTLSMGGLSAALSQGIYQFIDFYRYRKIGIDCWLQNDLFHLQGTAREGSDQHLIYGGLLPPRIDVIVSSPTISFKEMMSRLKRIERADN